MGLKEASRRAGSVKSWFGKSKDTNSLEYSNRVTVTSHRRSLQYYYAKAALSKVADYGQRKMDLGPVIAHFEKWMEKYRIGRFIKLSKDNKWLFIRCINRFMKDYKRTLWKKMKLLKFIEWDLKIDLTLDPKKFHLLENEFHFINRAWAKLRSWMLKRYGHFEFLKILEVQKAGRPHLHVLIRGIHYISHSDLTLIWQKYGGGFVWIRSLGKHINAVWYVLKYVNKTILGKNKVYASLLFASNKRMFSMSQNLMAMLDVRRHHKGKGWTFEGTVNENIVQEFCSEESIMFADIIEVEVETETYYKYPSLFYGWDAG